MTDRRILSFRDLDVWQSAMELAVECYTLTATFPRSEISLEDFAKYAPQAFAEFQEP